MKLRHQRINKSDTVKLENLLSQGWQVSSEDDTHVNLTKYQRIRHKKRGDVYGKDGKYKRSKAKRVETWNVEEKFGRFATT